MCCSICINSFEQCSTITLYCKHKFHKACLHLWLHENNSCPLCRKSVYRNRENAFEQKFNKWYIQKNIVIQDIMLYVEKNMKNVQEYFEHIAYINKTFLKVVRFLLLNNVDVAYIFIYMHTLPNQLDKILQTDKYELLFEQNNSLHHFLFCNDNNFSISPIVILPA